MAAAAPEPKRKSTASTAETSSASTSRNGASSKGANKRPTVPSDDSEEEVPFKKARSTAGKSASVGGKSKGKEREKESDTAHRKEEERETGKS